MDEQLDDLKLRIDQINHARRHLAHSVDASGIALRRALHADRPERKKAWEIWPRPTKVRSRFSPGVGVVLLLSVVVLLAVLLAAIVQRRWAAVQAARRDLAAEPATSSEPVVSLGRAFTRDPFVVYVRATRPCRVRVVVDGTALDWRPLQEGDELLSRPRQEMLIQSNDGGALSATVNGKPISLGPDGQAVAFRLTSEGVSRSYP